MLVEPARLLRDLGNFIGLGILRGVRVIAAGVDLELLQLLTAQLVVREHALDGLLNGALGIGCE